MKHSVLLAAIAIVAMSFDLRPAKASGDAPWCAVITLGEDVSYEDCRYRSFEECRPNVLAGNRGFCNPNPRYIGNNAAAKPRKAKRRYD
jgi:uncharacterized protein DUF3551